MGEAQFFSGWIFGTRSDMSRMGEPADTRAAVFAAENGGEGEERRGEGEASERGGLRVRDASELARSCGIDSQFVTLC